MADTGGAARPIAYHPTRHDVCDLFVNMPRHSATLRGLDSLPCEPNQIKPPHLHSDLHSTSSPVMAAQAVIYKPNEHADEYMVFIGDVAEVSDVPLFGCSSGCHVTVALE